MLTLILINIAIALLTMSKMIVGNADLDISMKSCGYTRIDKNMIADIRTRQNENEDKASMGEFPWMVSILPEQCGGAIVHEFWILTAAHCVQDTEPNKIKIYSKTLNKNTGTESTVNHTVIHEKYTGDGNFQYDIALLKLTKPLNAEKNDTNYLVNAVCMPKVDTDLIGTETVQYSGWGRRTTSYKNETIYLRKGTQQINESNECARTEKICIQQTDDILCAGDSGSLLVKSYRDRVVLLGVLSTTSNKGVMRFTRVSYYNSWIRRVMDFSKVDTSTKSTSQPNSAIQRKNNFHGISTLGLIFITTILLQ